MVVHPGLSNDPGKMDNNFFCYAATVLSPHRNVLIFTQRMHKPTGRPFTQLNTFTLHFQRVFLCAKRFSARVENSSQGKFTILHVPHIGFLNIITTDTRFCYMENGWKVRINICTALWSSHNFCCLSQSEISTDNRKVSTFLHSNMLVAVVAFVLIWTVS